MEEPRSGQSINELVWQHILRPIRPYGASNGCPRSGGAKVSQLPEQVEVYRSTGRRLEDEMLPFKLWSLMTDIITLIRNLFILPKSSLEAFLQLTNAVEKR